MKNPKINPVWGVLVIIAVVIAIVGISRMFVKPEVVPWRTDFAAAQAEAAQAGKPLFAYFTASWCGPCQYMRRATWTEEPVRDALAGYVPVKIDIDENPALAQRYGIGSIPVMAVLDSEGRPRRAMDRAMSAEEFVGWIARP